MHWVGRHGVLIRVWMLMLWKAIMPFMSLKQLSLAMRIASCWVFPKPNAELDAGLQKISPLRRAS